MSVDIRNNKDFWAGLMLVATGVTTVVIARDYPFGNILRLGPGFFPVVLGGILALFGLCLLVKGIRSPQKFEGNWSLRALIVLPSCAVLFGLLIDRAGFVPALAVLVFGSAAASSEFKFSEVALLTLAVVALSAALFIWGLGLPYPLIVGF